MLLSLEDHNWPRGLHTTSITCTKCRAQQSHPRSLTSSSIMDDYDKVCTYLCPLQLKKKRGSLPPGEVFPSCIPITPKLNNSCGVISCERLVVFCSRNPHPPPKTTRGNISNGTCSIPNGPRFTQHNTSSEWCPCIHPSQMDLPFCWYTISNKRYHLPNT